MWLVILMMPDWEPKAFCIVFERFQISFPALTWTYLGILSIVTIYIIYIKLHYIFSKIQVILYAITNVSETHIAYIFRLEIHACKITWRHNSKRYDPHFYLREGIKTQKTEYSQEISDSTLVSLYAYGKLLLQYVQLWIGCTASLSIIFLI